VLACEGELYGLNLDERNSVASELAEWYSSLEPELDLWQALAVVAMASLEAVVGLLVGAVVA